LPVKVFSIDPFGVAEPPLLGRGKEAQRRVNPHPRAPVPTDGGAGRLSDQAFRPESRRVDILCPVRIVIL